MSLSLDLEKSLHPSQDAISRAEVASMGNIEPLQHAAQIDARKAMNSMKTVGTALKISLIEEQEDQAARFQFLLDESSRLARAILVRMGINPEEKNNKWMINMVQKSVLPFITSTQSIQDDLVDTLVSFISVNASDNPENAFSAWQNEEMINFTILKGMGALMRAQSEFSFGRKNKDQDLVDLQNKIIEFSVSILNDLCPELTSHQDRVTFLTMILEEAFSFMEVSWQKNAIKAQAALSGLTKDQLKAWRQANPEGFALTPVLQQFEQNMNRLSRFTLAARKTDKKKK